METITDISLLTFSIHGSPRNIGSLTIRSQTIQDRMWFDWDGNIVKFYLINFIIFIVTFTINICMIF